MPNFQFCRRHGTAVISYGSSSDGLTDIATGTNLAMKSKLVKNRRPPFPKWLSVFCRPQNTPRFSDDYARPWDVRHRRVFCRTTLRENTRDERARTCI
jgi:hypothetical protein